MIELKSFTDPTLCVVTALKEYLIRTKFARETHSCSQLLLRYVKPYGPVSRHTLSRWVKFVLQSSRIDVNIFKPHRTRSASTSKAKLCDVPLADILDKAGWKSESTFAKFYDKNIVEDTFANNVFAVMCSLVWNCLLLVCASVCEVSYDPSVFDKVEYRSWMRLTGSWSSTAIPPLSPYTEGLREIALRLCELSLQSTSDVHCRK